MPVCTYVYISETMGRLSLAIAIRSSDSDGRATTAEASPADCIILIPDICAHLFHDICASLIPNICHHFNSRHMPSFQFPIYASIVPPTTLAYIACMHLSMRICLSPGLSGHGAVTMCNGIDMHLLANSAHLRCSYFAKPKQRRYDFFPPNRQIH